MDERLSERYGSASGAAAYRAKYDRSAIRRWSSRREMALVARMLARAGSRGEILDVPCAAGRLVPTLLASAGDGGRVTAVDRSPAMVAVAREALGGLVAAGRARVLEGDAAALPFPTGAFDTAVCWRLLHHLLERPARLRVWSELARVARRAVVVSFADAGTWKARMQAWRGRDRRCAKTTSEELAAEAAEAGLELVETARLSSAFSLLAAARLRPKVPVQTTV